MDERRHACDAQATAQDQAEHPHALNRTTALLYAIAAHLILFTLILNAATIWNAGEYMRKDEGLVLAIASDISIEPSAAVQTEPLNVTKAEAAAAQDTVDIVEALPYVPHRFAPVRSPALALEQATNDAMPADDPLEALRALLDQGSGNPQHSSSSGSGGGNIHAASYAARRGGMRTRALNSNGGSAMTEHALLDGLRWLASVQDLHLPRDDRQRGRWDADGYMRHYLKPHAMETDASFERRCEEEGAGSSSKDLGLSALVLLAFSGAGIDGNDAEFGATVQAGLAYLKGTQNQDGCFLLPHITPRGDMYDHALALFALADAFALSGDEGLRVPVVQGLRFLLSRQQRSGGWDYKCYPNNEEPRSDLSITGFCLMAINACRACAERQASVGDGDSGLHVPQSSLEALRRFIDVSSARTGEGLYADAGMGFMRTSTSMTAVNLYARRVLGQPMDAEMQQRQIMLILRQLPDFDNARSWHSDPYQWYYASLALVMSGGEAWERYNIALVREILAHQVKEPGPRKGSWRQDTLYEAQGGRIYTTTMACLCLEVYYRYLPSCAARMGEDMAQQWKE